jgi:hypothetical protein
MTDVKAFLGSQWNGNRPLDALVLDLAAQPGGITIGVLIHRLKKFSKDEIAQTLETMERVGSITIIAVPSGKRQKATLVIKAAER